MQPRNDTPRSQASLHRGGGLDPQALLAAIVQSSDDAIVSKSLDGTILSWNLAAERLFGYTAAEVVGRHITLIVPPELHQEEGDLLKRLERGERIEHFETVRIGTDGRRIDVSLSISPIRDDAGTVIGASKICRDVSDRKRAVSALRAAEERLQLAAEAAGFGTYELDLTAGVNRWSDSLKAIFGLPPDAPTPADPVDVGLIHPEHAARVREKMQRSFDPDGDGLFEDEHRILRPDGSERWVLVNGRTLFEGVDGERRGLRAFGTVIDITSRRLAEERAREGERVAETLNRVGSTLVAELDLERIVQLVTDEATALANAEFGAFFYNVTDEEGDHYTLYTLSGAPREAFSSFPMPRKTRLFAPTFEGRGVVRLADVTRDPRYGRAAPHFGMPKGHLPVRSYLAVPIVSRAGDVLGALFFGHSMPDVFTERHELIIAGIAAQAAIALDNANLYSRLQTDIVERKRVEQALRQSEARHRHLLELLPVAVYTCAAPSGLITYYNEQAARLWGRAPVSGDTDERFCGSLKLFLPDGTFLPHAECPMAVTLREGRRYRNAEVQIERPDGLRVDVLVNIDPILDEGGRIVGAVNVFHDISAVKRAEEALREADRRKDEFLATLAHELRNPLAPLRNMLEVMKLAEREPALMHRATEIMERQLAHMVRLIDDLLDLSRITRNRLELRKEPVDLAAIINHAIETCRPLVQERRHELSVSLPAEQVVLYADSARLGQVFSNLLHNACKYTPPGGRIAIRAQRLESTVAVSVADSGAGISSENLISIFEMFSQVDSPVESAREGLGIGLTLVKQLVAMHRGSVKALSAGPGMGSEFVVTLPLTAGVAPPEPLPAPVAAPARARRRVLVVDDNQDAADSLAMLFALNGHETRTANDGAQALQVSESFRPELVLLDIGLPKMNGYDVCRALRGRPWARDLMLIAVTGWGQDRDRRKSREAGFDDHLVKPLHPETLNTLLAGMSGATDRKM